MVDHMHRRSFVDKVTHGSSNAFSGGWHGLEWTFDKLMRTNYAMAEGVRRASEGKNRGSGLHVYSEFAKGFSRGLQGKRKTTFSDVLKQHHVLDHHTILRAGAGFGLDVLADPLTYVTGGTSAVADTGIKGAAHAAGRLAIEGDKVAKGEKALSGAAKAAKWRKVETIAKEGGKDYEWRAALARERARHATLKTLNESDRAQLRTVAEAALREEKKVAKRLPQLRFGTRAHGIKTPTHILGKRVVPALPKARNIPVAKGFIGFMGKAVGSGKGDIIRGIRVSTKHIMEELSPEYIGYVRRKLETMPKLETERAVRTLAHFEKKGGVKKVVGKDGKVDFVLNEKRINKLKSEGKINEDDIALLRGWHDIAQQMWRYDQAFGIKYEHIGNQGRLYVPHLVDRVGQPYTIAQKNMLKKQGYTKGRSKYMTLEHIHNLHKEGHLPRNVETDPYKMLVSMARSRAHQHSDKAAVDAIARAVGVPKKIVTKEAQRAIERKTVQRDALAVTLDRFNTPSLRNLKQVKGLQKQHDALEKEVKKLLGGKKNKAAGKDFVDLKDLRDEFGNKVVVEPDIAEALTKYEKIVDPTDDVAITGFARGWANMVGRWKLMVTAVNPGYRIRNTLSDFWNMYLAGVPTWAFGRYGGRAAKLMVDAKKGDEKAIRILSDAYKAGILSGLFGGDIDTLALMLKASGSKRALAKQGRFVRLGSKVAQDVNRNGENWGRLVHYLYRREHQGMSIEDAAFEVKKAHFDYEDLTEFERKKLKGSLIPFYTWTRKNIPYQLQALVSHPGQYSVFPKFAIESEKAAGGDKGTILPDYMTKNFSFQIPLGKHTYTTPQLGMGDLARFFEGRNTAMQSAMGMVNPAFKIPAEIALNKSFFTGQPIADPAGHPRTPISDWAAPFVSLIPGANVGPTARQTGKGRVEGAGASPWIAYAFGQSPWTRALFLGGKIRHQQKGVSPWWGQLGGVQISKIDPEQQILLERLALKDKLKGRMKGLRDEGRFPQAEAKRQSAYELDLQRRLARNLGR